MQDDSTGPRMARDAMVLGSGGSPDQGTPTAHWKTLLKQPHSNRFHNNVEYLNLHVWLLDSRNPILGDSHLRWQKELRHLRGNPQEKSINQGGPATVPEVAKIFNLPVHSQKSQTSHNYWLQNSNC